MMCWTVINGDKGVSSLKVTQWSRLLLANPHCCEIDTTKQVQYVDANLEIFPEFSQPCDEIYYQV